MNDNDDATTHAATDKQLREAVYERLRQVAEAIGANNYMRGWYYRGGGYAITQAHRLIVDAMSKLWNYQIDPAEALALLGIPAVQQQAFEPVTVQIERW